MKKTIATTAISVIAMLALAGPAQAGLGEPGPNPPPPPAKPHFKTRHVDGIGGDCLFQRKRLKITGHYTRWHTISITLTPCA